MENFYKKELDVFIDLAREVGKVLLEGYNSVSNVEKKKDGTLVSNIDKEASDLIHSKISTFFPSYSLIDEERSNDKLFPINNGKVVISDPLDGTRGFIQKTESANEGDFGTILGLLDNHEPVLGVAYLPKKDLLLYAVKGKGAYTIGIDGKPKKIYVNKKMPNHILASDSKNPNEDVDAIIKELNLKEDCITRKGSSFKITDIALGLGTTYVHPSSKGIHLWDICGTSVILKESGGIITDTLGNLIDYKSQKKTRLENGILASNGVNHDFLVETIRRSKQ